MGMTGLEYNNMPRPFKDLTVLSFKVHATKNGHLRQPVQNDITQNDQRCEPLIYPSAEPRTKNQSINSLGPFTWRLNSKTLIPSILSNGQSLLSRGIKLPAGPSADPPMSIDRAHRHLYGHCELVSNSLLLKFWALAT
jgi:hypothetical protein